MQYYFLFGLQMKHLTAAAAGAACGEEGKYRMLRRDEYRTWVVAEPDSCPMFPLATSHLHRSKILSSSAWHKAGVPMGRWPPHAETARNPGV